MAGIGGAKMPIAHRVSSGLWCLFLLAYVFPASAEDQQDYNSFRTGGFVGAFVPNSARWEGSGTIPGLPPLTASGRLILNTGTAAGGFVGYTFDDFLGIEWLKRKVNVEAQLGFVTQTFSKLDGTVSIVGLGDFTGKMPVQGHVNTLAGGVNFLLCPFGQRAIGSESHPLTPYIGFGPAIARSDVVLNAFTVGTSTIPVNADSSETDPAINFTVGVDIEPLPQTLPKLELGLAYQYSRIFSNHLGTGSGIAANSGNVSGHIFGLVLEYRVMEER
jgi:opacity protein-like surface antigen